jgi:hypothetical protein
MLEGCEDFEQPKCLAYTRCMYAIHTHSVTGLPASQFYVCMYVCTYAFAGICMLQCICVDRFERFEQPKCLAGIHKVYVCMCAGVYYVFVCVFIYIYICMYIYIYIHTHTVASYGRVGTRKPYLGFRLTPVRGVGGWA